MEKEESLFFDISEYALKRKKITKNTHPALPISCFMRKNEFFNGENDSLS